MTRSRASAKQAGTSFETLVTKYLAAELNDDRIERRARNGAKDRGDIGGLRHMGLRIIAECKDYGGSVKVGEWLKEADIERGNDSAEVGLVVAKRARTRDPGSQIVMMTLRDLVALLSGSRPDERAA